MDRITSDADEKILKRARAPSGHPALDLHHKIAQVSSDLIKLCLSIEQHKSALERREPFWQRRVRQADLLRRDFSSSKRDPSRLIERTNHTKCWRRLTLYLTGGRQDTRQSLGLDCSGEELEEIGSGHRPRNLQLEPRSGLQERDQRFSIAHQDRAIHTRQIRNANASCLDKHDGGEVFGRNTIFPDQGLSVADAKLAGY